ncbi:hypothetical protein SPHINGOT1_660053 [Sphingomonas sp. T1]|nr:hypothetical protein SPHINGOT1_660053 [Sphingomonas sp. T1]
MFYPMKSYLYKNRTKFFTTASAY